MQVKSTENQKMSLGRPVQGNCHIGCNTGSTGSDSGSTAATAERTGKKTRRDKSMQHLHMKRKSSFSLTLLVFLLNKIRY